ncbi:uncharacterized protein LOC105700781 [Orussus abietinus]|uniref:uncharacterized protein LOC105700781 n=1 Tax=Orussus abietinus TaxID=222816 RepID=UPI000C71620A|nr:uncharacterized protein LOC105700781 [Orussus abietinus]
MKFLIVSMAVLAVAFAQYGQVPASGQPPIAILRQAQDISPEGSYNFSYETENGIAVSESGSPQPAGPDGEPAVAAQGQYQYTAPDGTPISVSYVADENGFQPQGEHLPVAPPVPEAILRSLEFNAAHPQAEEPATQQRHRQSPQIRAPLGRIEEGRDLILQAFESPRRSATPPTMKILIAVLGIVTVVQAQLNRYPQYPDYYGRRFAILRQTQDSSPDGSYTFSYDTENGISVAEQGQPTNLGVAGQGEVVRGQYSYTAPDGTPITVTYIADENGFHPSGAHLPTPPPIPPAIQRSLAYNAAHPEEDNGVPYRRF